MVDIELTIRSLRLAWIQRLIFGNKGNWKNVPDHFFKNMVASTSYSGVTTIPNTLDIFQNFTETYLLPLTKLKLCTTMIKETTLSFSTIRIF